MTRKHDVCTYSGVIFLTRMQGAVGEQPDFPLELTGFSPQQLKGDI